MGRRCRAGRGASGRKPEVSPQRAGVPVPKFGRRGACGGFPEGPSGHNPWMPVFHRDGCNLLFVHIPKTGGTFVERQLKANGWRASFLLHGQQERHLLGLMHASPQHLHWAQLCALFDPTAFDLAFAIVRDPLERAISEYRMRSKARVRPFDEWLHDVLLKRASGPFHLDNHLRPQHEFVGPGVEVLRFEDGLDEGLMARLSRACGRDLVLQPLPRRADASLVRRAEVVPGRAALDLLARVYAEDYRRFGYPLP